MPAVSFREGRYPWIYGNCVVWPWNVSFQGMRQLESPPILCFLHWYAVALWNIRRLQELWTWSFLYTFFPYNNSDLHRTKNGDITGALLGPRFENAESRSESQQQPSSERHLAPSLATEVSLSVEKMPCSKVKYPLVNWHSGLEYPHFQ